MPFLGRKEYEESKPLQMLAQKIAQTLPALEAAESSRFLCLYSLTELDHIGGKCRKLDGAIKKVTGLDFLILVHKTPFVDSDELHKFRLLVHELYHIERHKDSFRVRHHENDFCEIPEHDRFSYRLALTALASLDVGYDKQDQIEKFVGIKPT